MGIKTKARKLIKSPRKFKEGTHYNVSDVDNKTVLVLYELDENFGHMRNIMTYIFFSILIIAVYKCFCTWLPSFFTLTH